MKAFLTSKESSESGKWRHSAMDKIVGHAPIILVSLSSAKSCRLNASIHVDTCTCSTHQKNRTKSHKNLVSCQVILFQVPWALEYFRPIKYTWTWFIQADKNNMSIDRGLGYTGSYLVLRYWSISPCWRAANSWQIPCVGLQIYAQAWVPRSDC